MVKDNKKPRCAVGRGFELFPRKVGTLSTVSQVLFTKAATPQLKPGFPLYKC